MGLTVEQLLRAGDGVITVSGDRSERDRLHYAARTGQVARVLPGVFVDPGATADLRILARAAMRACPDSVITGAAAASLSYWPELASRPGFTATNLAVAIPRKHPDHGPFSFTDRHIPADLVVTIDGIRLTAPALTALDLCTGPLGPEAIDRALQLGAVKVRELLRTLDRTPNRPGNTVRRQLIRDVKTEGCSPLERKGHRYLREAGIGGWVANRPFAVLGQKPRPDVRFRARKLVLEFDGFAYHSSRDAFENDRERDNLFMLAGFLVLRFTDRMLRNQSLFIEQVRHGLRVAARY